MTEFDFFFDVDLDVVELIHEYEFDCSFTHDEFQHRHFWAISLNVNKLIIYSLNIAKFT